MHFDYAFQNGILRYLFTIHGFTFPQYISLQESNHRLDYQIKNAFDFDYSINSYWISNTSQGYFSICFPFHSITIESFELTTSSKTCRPKRFAVEVSNDGKNYLGYQSYEHVMTEKETKQFLFNLNSSFIRCFKFYNIESTCNPDLQLGADIDQVEFFGNLTEINQTVNAFGCPKEKYITCNPRWGRPLELFLMFVVL